VLFSRSAVPQNKVQPLEKRGSHLSIAITYDTIDVTGDTYFEVSTLLGGPHLQLSQQDAIGHELQASIGAHVLVIPHLHDVFVCVCVCESEWMCV